MYAKCAFAGLPFENLPKITVLWTWLAFTLHVPFYATRQCQTLVHAGMHVLTAPPTAVIPCAIGACVQLTRQGNEIHYLATTQVAISLTHHLVLIKKYFSGKGQPQMWEDNQHS